jgi:PPK2 family polyphosphate:nucleotide phosphotransferase
MSTSSRIREASRLARQFTITKGRRFRLSDVDPDDTGGIDSKEHAAALLAEGVARLQGLQEKLYAQGQWAVLLIFQAMDAAGKDSIIKHVMSGVNPQGCQVFSFKAPSSEDLAHDFLWRTTRCLPERGRIGIFNRSYYEEALVVRVHPELLARQRLPAAVVSKRIWRERFDDINTFERHLQRSGIAVCKFFLHVSKDRQKERFLERLDKPEKNWKFSGADLEERRFWDDYQRAFEDTLSHTSTRAASWWVIPADNKWISRGLVSAILVDQIKSLGLKRPQMPDNQQAILAKARQQLLAER